MEEIKKEGVDKSHPEYQYLDLLKEIMETGVEKKDHNTGIKLKSVFGRMARFDLSKGYPLLTTKKIYWRGILHELYWFMSGQTNVKYLIDNDVKIWNDYPYKVYKKASEKGDVPPMTLEEFVAKLKELPADHPFVKKWGELPRIYGEQWRAWPAADGRKIDQLSWIIDTLKNFPDRKHAVLSAWNPQFLYAMAKPGEALTFPLCHILFHFNVANGKLSCALYQRSCDMFLGVPFNIASYAMLTCIIAKICGYEPGEFVHIYGDAHIYENHYEQVKEQITRIPRQFPKLLISDEVKSLETFKPELVSLEGYDPYPILKADMTVAGGFDEKDRTVNKLDIKDAKPFDAKRPFLS